MRWCRCNFPQVPDLLSAGCPEKGDLSPPTCAPTLFHPVSSFPLKASLIRNILGMLRWWRVSITHGIWSLPNYVVFALDERVLSMLCFQPRVLQQPASFSWWLLASLSSWAQLTQDLSHQVCTCIAALLSGACNLGFVT